jgi:phosphoglycolate phosphatase
MPIKLLMFDLDGTLVDTIQDITAALNYAMQPYGIQTLTIERTVKLVGEGLTKLVERVLEDKTSYLKEPVTRRFLEYYSEHLADCSVAYPNVRETLGILAGYKKTVISNKREFLSTKLLSSLDLLKEFDVIVGSDTTDERKPSPAPVRYVLDKLGVDSREAVMVGDSSFDIETGRKAGVIAIAVTHGYGEKEHLKKADYIIDDFMELPHILDIASSKFI